ncbi:hypothetical protein G6F63_016219 [Rhizopus arrhizus]|nr:hypothetical protein G6F63_016219 [Rhizopus arrhizus]
MRLARFQQDVTGRIQAERVARAQSALHHMDVALGAGQVDVAATLDGGAARDLAAAISTAAGGLEPDAGLGTEQHWHQRRGPASSAGGRRTFGRRRHC